MKWWGKNGFNHDEILKNRKHAASTFLPRWKGFITNTAECEPVPATEAFEQIHVICQSLTYVYLSAGYDAMTTIVQGLEFYKVRLDEVEHIIITIIIITTLFNEGITK